MYRRLAVPISRLVRRLAEAAGIALKDDLSAIDAQFAGVHAGFETLQHRVSDFQNATTTQMETSRQLIANTQNLLENKFPSVTAEIQALRASLVSTSLHTRLSAFEAARSVNAARFKPTRAPAPLVQSNLAESFAKLEMRYPRLFPIWKELADAAEEAYRLQPTTSLSVHDNPVATMFRAFCLPLLKGAVLDIGCGPIAVPAYLDGYDVEALAGMDPFGTAEAHPFVFANAIAEAIPWPDQSFDTAVIATSLDHLLDLELGISEIARVLKPGGHAVLWVGFVPNSPRYDPTKRETDRIDEYHLFHFDRPWFRELMSKQFSCAEELNFDGLSYFYQYRVKS